MILILLRAATATVATCWHVEERGYLASRFTRTAPKSTPKDTFGTVLHLTSIRGFDADSKSVSEGEKATVLQ
jgi:hypothetical protein